MNVQSIFDNHFLLFLLDKIYFCTFNSEYGNINTNLDVDDEEDDFDSNNQQALNKPALALNSGILREEGKPAGLKNVGNTCWFNSIIQVGIYI